MVFDFRMPVDKKTMECCLSVKIVVFLCLLWITNGSTEGFTNNFGAASNSSQEKQDHIYFIDSDETDSSTKPWENSPETSAVQDDQNLAYTNKNDTREFSVTTPLNTATNIVLGSDKSVLNTNNQLPELSTAQEDPNFIYTSEDNTLQFSVTTPLNTATNIVLVSHTSVLNTNNQFPELSTIQEDPNFLYTSEDNTPEFSVTTPMATNIVFGDDAINTNNQLPELSTAKDNQNLISTNNNDIPEFSVTTPMSTTANIVIASDVSVLNTNNQLPELSTTQEDPNFLYTSEDNTPEFSVTTPMATNIVFGDDAINTNNQLPELSTAKDNQNLISTNNNDSPEFSVTTSMSTTTNIVLGSDTSASNSNSQLPQLATIQNNQNLVSTNGNDSPEFSVTTPMSMVSNIVFGGDSLNRNNQLPEAPKAQLFENRFYANRNNIPEFSASTPLSTTTNAVLGSDTSKLSNQQDVVVEPVSASQENSQNGKGFNVYVNGDKKLNIYYKEFRKTHFLKDMLFKFLPRPFSNLFQQPQTTFLRKRILKRLAKRSIDTREVNKEDFFLNQQLSKLCNTPYGRIDKCAELKKQKKLTNAIETRYDAATLNTKEEELVPNSNIRLYNSKRRDQFEDFDQYEPPDRFISWHDTKYPPPPSKYPDPLYYHPEPKYYHYYLNKNDIENERKRYEEFDPDDEVYILKSSDYPKSYKEIAPRRNLPICGRISKPFSQKIIGGTRVALGEYPWMALIQYRGTSNIINGCGGALINSRYILTAAHCIDETILKRRNLEFYRIVLGEYDTKNELDCTEGICSDAVQVYNAVEMIKHNKFNTEDALHDIALIRLEEEVKFSDYIKPICLPTPSLTISQNGKESLIVAGWGRTSTKGSYSRILTKATLPVVSQDHCTSRGVTLNPGQLCLGMGNGKDTCTGDSGGPMMMQIVENAEVVTYLVGIISYGFATEECGQAPSVNTFVSYYLDWINSKIN